jgi:hypothetical protein
MKIVDEIAHDATDRWARACARRERIRELGAKPGDVLGLSSGWTIRVATGEGYSHVAMLHIDTDHDLCVVETSGMRGGYRRIGLVDWLMGQDGREVTLGTAPDVVARNRPQVIAAVDAYEMEFRRKPWKRLYGYLTLPLVWVSQITKIEFPFYLPVCSTLIQRFWGAAGWELGRLADPGDIMRACPVRHNV